MRNKQKTGTYQSDSSFQSCYSVKDTFSDTNYSNLKQLSSSWGALEL